MKTHTSPIPHALVAGCLVAVSFFSVPSAEAGVKCYPDADGDGYGTGSRVAFNQDICPANYAVKNGDCKDGVKSIHPGRGEVGYNGEDDNCAGGVDEPTFKYFTEGNLNTASSFRMTVYLNHSDILRAALLGTLYVDVEYAKLADSQHSTTLERVQVISYGAAEQTALLSLWDLDSATVYRAKVTFWKKLSALSYQQAGPTSDWYYTMTLGETFTPHRRSLMVLKGLKEFDESYKGRVGYLGTVAPDGTRYGAVLNEPWCSEFYVFATQPFLVGIAEAYYWRPLVEFFSTANSFYRETEIPTRAAPGDYLPIDTGRRGVVDHTAMFLAYDTSQVPPSVWTLEGNADSKVLVKSRTFEYTTWQLVGAQPPPGGTPGYVGAPSQWVIDYSYFAGLGAITRDMLW